MAIIKVKKQSSIKYLVRLRDKNKTWFPSKSFTSKKEASEYEKGLWAQKSDGLRASKSNLLKLTLDAYFEIWERDCRRHVSLGWKHAQRTDYKNHVSPIIGKTKLSDVRSNDIRTVLERLREKKFASQSQVHVYNLLHKLFEDVTQFFDCRIENPVLKKLKAKLVNRNTQSLSPAQVNLLLQSVRDVEVVGPATWIMGLAGLRCCELQSLQWRHVNLDNSQIEVAQRFVRREGKIKSGTKQGSNTAIYMMPAQLCDYLRSSFPNRRSADYVVQAAGGKMVTHSWLYKQIKSVSSKLGLPSISPHSLRHSLPELIYEAGGDIESVRRQLNHSSTSTTLRYMHARQDGRLKQVISGVRIG